MKLVKKERRVYHMTGRLILSAVHLLSGKKKGKSRIGEMFDLVGESDLFGENTWEEAESTMQREGLSACHGKGACQPESGTVSVWWGSSKTGELQRA